MHIKQKNGHRKIKKFNLLLRIYSLLEKTMIWIRGSSFIYLLLSNHVKEHWPSTTILQPTMSPLIPPICFQLLFILFDACFQFPTQCVPWSYSFLLALSPFLNLDKFYNVDSLKNVQRRCGRQGVCN